MADLDNIRNSLSNVSRSVWLGLGLVVVAALLAVAFIYGDTDDLANQNDREETTEERAVDGENGDEARVGEAEDENGDETRVGESTDGNGDLNNDQVAVTGGEEVALPRELADTGPVAPLLAIGALSLTGYMYRRSRQDLKDTQSR